MTRVFAQPLLIGLIAGAVGLSAEASAQDKDGLATYKNDRHGFTLSYPTGQFIAFPPATPDGLQFVSKDGKARMLVRTLTNSASKTLTDYRSFLIAES